MHRVAARSLAALWFVVAASAPAQEPAAAPPASARPAVRNLVVVTLDTLRSDHLACYGYFRDTMPQLRALGERSLRFARCLTPVAQTTPSHVSLFTGVAPDEHGVLSNHALTADEGLATSATLQTLAQALRAAGMRTGAFVAATPVKRASGLDQGFDVWSEPSNARRRGEEVVAEAARFIAECGERPFFAWIHLYDAHDPLTSQWIPQHHLDRFSEEPTAAAWRAERGIVKQVIERGGRPHPITDSHHQYDGALRYLDENFGLLLAKLRSAGREEETVLVAIADHGTALGQHDLYGHGMCWDELLRVPLYVHVPGVAPAVIETPLSTLDVWPTVMGLAPALANAAFLAQCRGVDVLLHDHDPRPLFGVAALKRGVASVTFGRWKLLRVRANELQLYDLEADPHEQKDVARANGEIVQRLTALLDAELARQQRARALHATSRKEGTSPDPKLLEELRALGYTDEGDDRP
ncbi:MAG: sulfatase [Planctomycetes bacterium]|nr:sulfatase [Planctomycetota bacterium]